MTSDGMESGHITLALQTPTSGRLHYSRKKNYVIYDYVIYETIHNNKKRNVAKVNDLLINHGGVTSTNTMCQVSLFLMLPHGLPMYLVSGIILPRHWQSLYGESFGFPGGAVALRPNILWSTPPIQKSTIKSTLVVSLPIPGIVCVWQTC